MPGATKTHPRITRLLAPASPTCPGLVQITAGGRSAVYWFRPTPADQGRAFEVRKYGAKEAYHVHLEAGGKGSCTCKGGSYVGRCRHRDAFTALVDGRRA